MSALGTTVRVNSENQTLILAGEAVPRRSATESRARSVAYAAAPLRRPLTIVATPVDDPKLIIQGEFAHVSVDITALPRNLVASYRLADGGSSSIAANAYARTQSLSVGSAHTAIIDTYA
jgi:hypothetical protein